MIYYCDIQRDMNKLWNKSKHKNHLYARRKHRTNTLAKQHTDDATPRLIVQRSNKHIYAQLISVDGKVLAQANDASVTSWTKSEKAFSVGETIWKQAVSLWYTTLVFDRNGYLYHGRVQQVADGARSAGLQF